MLCPVKVRRPEGKDVPDRLSRLTRETRGLVGPFPEPLASLPFSFLQAQLVWAHILNFFALAINHFFFSVDMLIFLSNY